jgi:protein phosphatase
MQYQCRTGHASDKGPRQRNEDSVYVDEDLGFAVIADGMGGAAGGAHASGMAVELAAKFVRENLTGTRSEDELWRLLGTLVEEANHQIHQKGEATPALRGMGTTLVLILFRGQRFYVVNVGDSRAYRVQQGGVTQLSRDHSLVQERVDAGLIAPEEAARQPDRSVITRAVGVYPSVEPAITLGEVGDGDTFILTSDGVHAAVLEEALREAASERDPQIAASKLVESAVSQGTTDNATAAVVRVVSNPFEDTESELESILWPSKYSVKKSPGSKAIRVWALLTLLGALAVACGAVLWKILRS